MRTCKFAAVVLVAFTVALASTTTSYGLLADTTYFDFSGWDHDTVVSDAGQDFDLGGGIMVNVKGLGIFSVESMFSAGFIRDGALNAGEFNAFTFSFNQVLPLVVKTATVDEDEIVEVFGGNPATYFHDFGAPPTVTPSPNGITLQGNGFGINPTGAAQGETVVGMTDTLLISHESLFFLKYEQFMVGTVPEPATPSLLLFGLAGMLGLRRRIG